MKIFRRAKTNGGRNDGKSPATRMVTGFFHALTLSEVIALLQKQIRHI